MIVNNTVFILGAGASADFGFPSGEELRQRIIQGFIATDSQTYKDVESIAKALSVPDEDEFNDYIKPINEFAYKLKHDAGYSIDAFLERFKESYLEIGKLAIASILAKCENQDIFYSSDNWYRIIYDRMKQGASIDTFPQNRVSFITFNYDRSLEQFLYNGLLNFHEKVTENYVRNIISQIPIVHIYGQLDPLPWQNPDGRSYNRHITLGQLKRYRENISIVFEKITETTNSNFQKAVALLEQADRVYILGFGFHADNFSRLKLAELTLRKKIMATSYGLGPQVADSIAQAYRGIRIYQPSTIKTDYSNGLCLHPMKVYDFVKELAGSNLLN